MNKKLKKEKGICVDCTEPAFNGHIRCAGCIMKDHARFKKRQSENKKNKVCVRCGKEPMPKKNMCEECLQYSSNWCKEIRKKRKKEGLCSECGELTIDGKLCQIHYDKRIQVMQNCKQKRSIRRSNGLCEACGNLDIIQRPNREVVYCEACYFKTMSRKHFKTSSQWKNLKELFYKQPICPYTGIKLQIGVNASLDHKIPKSVGRSNNLENLQFVYSNGDFDRNGFHGGFDVNIMKGTLTDEKFKEVIKTMYENIYLTSNR